ncbi:methyltransferase domain-containing protein [uncultured Erythrobacter sp.]|uniref:methyltransferase domain-containing protein n=1 Tax=uncultured Erythrobacter sp. TaxID=263913 RepID=UPI0026359219|nr:methyltransferase domain-containing protein [uncultured Erythrobacter sp.]
MNLQNSQEYYGQVLKRTDDLRTDACTMADIPPPHVVEALANVHPEVKARYYGCGLVAPTGIEGARILDLGSGSGQDAYVLAQLVGPTGEVVGVDVTPEQLEVAREHLEWHRERFGYDSSNVSFIEGNIEELEDLGFEPGSFDIIISNCVINLASDKARIFHAAHKLLKLGGEMFFSDVYGDRRIPEALQQDPVLHGECLSGALYWGDFMMFAKEAGFTDPRTVIHRALSINDSAIAAKLDGFRFLSATCRLFKLKGLEPECEDYGQAVIYRGGVQGEERVFNLDNKHQIERGRVFPVCGNTWKMLADTRFAQHFDFVGNFDHHYGIFEGCGGSLPFDSHEESEAVSCC